MSIDSYRFVSPGVFFQEIDQSQIATARPERGPVIISRFPKGPGMRPVAITSAAEFYNLYGNPHPGGGPAGDAWRGDPHGGPTYGAYAAEAHLHSGQSPATIFRLLGEAHPTPSSDNYAKAGWTTRNAAGAQKSPSAAVSSNGGAYGLFIVPSGSTAAMNTTGTLGAIFYLTEGTIELQGTGDGPDGVVGNQTASLGSMIASDSSTGAVANTFNIRIKNSSGAVVDSAYVDFNYDTDSRSNTDWCRTAFNTDPAATNSNIKGSAKTYWLGETFEGMIKEKVTEVQSDAGKQYGVILPLHDGTNSYADHRENWANPSTGWFFSNDTGVATSFDVYNMTKLFKFHSLDGAEWAQENLRISIENLSQYTSETYKYGSFDVVVRSLSGGEDSTSVLEIFTNCNLDRRSPNYIGRKVGDRYVSWDNTNKVQRGYGSFSNKSSYIRVELGEALSEGSPEGLLPFGVYGPPRLRSFYVASGSTGFFSGSESRSTSGTVTPGFGHYAAATGMVSTEGVAGRFATGDGSAMPATHPVDSTVSGVGATATIIVKTTNPAQLRDMKFTLISSDGTSKQYQTHDALADSYETGDVSSDGVSILADIKGLSSEATIATEIKNAIEATLGHNGKITCALSTTTATNDTITLTQATAGVAGNTVTSAVTNGDATYLTLQGGIAASTFTGGSAGEVWFGSSAGWSGANFKIEYPAPKLVGTAKIDGSSNFHRFFGVEWSKWKTSGSSGYELDSLGGQLDQSLKETLRRLPASVATADPASSAAVEYSWIFTLDDVIYNSTGSEGFYVSGSRAAGTSYTALKGASNSDSDGLLQIGTDNKGFHGFSTVLQGGFDGLDICEAEPFRNTLLDDAAGDATKVAAYNTLIRGIETCADPEYVECNIMVSPGITDTYVTDKLVRTAEERADALAIIDLAGGYVPETENASAESARRGSVKSVVSNKNSRNIDSSYGCAYYPWVQVKSATAAAGGEVYVPPSVIALGTMASSGKAAGVWFAPAGFTRGGLDSAGSAAGAAGLKVLDVRDRLTSSDRDSLYAVNINPIAKFPAEGIVVFGQKTLQATRSALDRINVRRLMLHVKKEISIIASTVLFQNNVADTWTSFKTDCEALLSTIQSQYGITEYKVVLDDTTTTADLVDRNILYAQVYLKPARAIEFIAVDFIISSEGASFAD